MAYRDLAQCRQDIDRMKIMICKFNGIFARVSAGGSITAESCSLSCLAYLQVGASSAPRREGRTVKDLCQYSVQRFV